LTIAVAVAIELDLRRRIAQAIGGQRNVLPADHRISFGCINVPAPFFDTVVNPAFKDTHGIVYILPEMKEVRAVFPAYYDVDDPVQTAVN